MPRFFFAFKWADYARVPLLLRVVCTVQRAGMGRIRIGKVAKGEREGREGWAWQQNIYTLRIADYAANLARWMRPPCSKSYFPLDWHHVAGWQCWHSERCPFSRVKINFKFKLPKWGKSIHVTVNYHEFFNLFTKIILSSLAGVIGMNVMCFVLSLAAVVTWLAQFFLRLRKNVLIREDIANGGWSSEGEATVGYSFWLVFIASIGTDQLIDTADQLSNQVIKTVI